MANFGLDPAAGAGKLAFGDGRRNNPRSRHHRILTLVCVNDQLGVGALLAAIQAWADQQDTSMSTPSDQNEANK